MNDDVPTQPFSVPQIPDYRMIRDIETGAFGEVWLAQSEATKRYRAVKMVLRERFPSHRPFEMEFAGLKRFEEISREHEGFVDILHVGGNDQAPYFYYVMELADDLETGPQINEGNYVPRTLARELAKRKRLPPAECVRIGLALTAALAELHRRSLVHRDVKPSNILFVRGAPKLADIGLVTEVRLEAATLIGTPHYMDPSSHGTAQGDIYSLGKVLYVMATGQSPSDWPHSPADTEQLEDPDGLRDLEQIYRRACQEPARRYHSAEEVHQHLLVLRAGRSVRRLQKLEWFEMSLKRYGLVALISISLAAIAVYQWIRQVRQAAELSQRTIGSYVAYGTRAMDEMDVLGALPWFVEALRLEKKNPAHEANHRLRLGSILHRSPTIVQMWFHHSAYDYPYYFAAFAGQENQVLCRDPDDGWGVFDLATKKQLFPGIGTGSEEELAAICPAASWAVTAKGTNTVQLWNYKTGALLRTLQYSTNTFGATLSPDGQWVAAWALDKTAVIWNARTGEIKRILPGGTNTLISIAFSPTGRWLVTTDNHGHTIIWDQNEDNPWKTLAAASNTNMVFRAAFSRDERWVATANLDRSVRIWDLESGRESLPPLWHDDGVQSVEFDAHGQRLVSAALDCTARVWDAPTGKLLYILPHNTKLANASFSPSGRYVITATHDGITRVWDLRPDPPEAETQPVSVSPNGARLAIRQGNAIQVLESANRRLVAVIPLNHHELRNILFDVHGNQMLILSAAHASNQPSSLTAVLWDITNPAQEKQKLNLPHGMSNLVLSATGSRLAAFSTSQLLVWDLPSNRPLLSLTQAVQRIAFAPKDNRMAVASSKTVMVWRLDTRPPSALPFSPLHTTVDSLEWSHNGRYLAAGCWDTRFHPESAQIWIAARSRPFGPPLSHRDGIRAIAFSPGDDKVITCSEDFTAILWEVQTGRQLAPLLRHKHHVIFSAFSHDGRWVATACRDGSVRVWDSSSGEPLTPPLFHTSEVHFLQFINHSRQLFTKMQNGQTRLWELHLDHRGVEDLARIAELLSTQQSHPTEMRPPHSKETLNTIWSFLHTNYPSEFAIGEH